MELVINTDAYSKEGALNMIREYYDDEEDKKFIYRAGYFVHFLVREYGGKYEVETGRIGRRSRQHGKNHYRVYDPSHHSRTFHEDQLFSTKAGALQKIEELENKFKYKVGDTAHFLVREDGAGEEVVTGIIDNRFQYNGKNHYSLTDTTSTSFYIMHEDQLFSTWKEAKEKIEERKCKYKYKVGDTLYRVVRQASNKNKPRLLKFKVTERLSNFKGENKYLTSCSAYAGNYPKLESDLFSTKEEAILSFMENYIADTAAKGSKVLELLLKQK